MPDCLDTLARISPRKRRRLSSLFFGSFGLEASEQFLAELAAELGPLGVPADNLGTFFATDIELDAVYAAFRAGGRFEDADAPPIDDRRGTMEMDGACLDALLAARSPDGSFDLVILHARLSGRWTGRNFRRLAGRLRHVFGEDGAALAGVRPRFVALGPERPGPGMTAAWPAWMRRNDGASFWMPLSRARDELRIVRCDKRGRPRRIGEFWKLA